MSNSQRQQSPPSRLHIDRLDFDANRGAIQSDTLRGGRRLLDDDVDLMEQVVDGILELDRRRMRRQVIRALSFVCAMVSCLCANSISTYSLYAPGFLTHLRYTQLQVNAISIAAEMGLYLLVPLFGFLCDRYSPAPLSLLSSLLLGFGYLFAAFVYRAGPPAGGGLAGSHGLPYGLMMLAFVTIGAGTACMYLAAVATCAKNFSTSQYRGLILALPIAAFGLSGMWESQVGAYILYERLPSGAKGGVDIFRYFLFLGFLLLAVGLIGAFGLRIVDEEEVIERGVKEAERRSLLQDRENFDAHDEHGRNYGAVDAGNGDDGTIVETNSSAQVQPKKHQGEEDKPHRSKNWLLNQETRSFLSDGTMWLLAAGFFLVSGPGEAYINNVGTIIPTLTPNIWTGPPPAGEISTHVSIIALTSTIARIVTGTMSDIFAPRPEPPSSSQPQLQTRTQISRVALLLPSAIVLSLGYLTMSLPPFVPADPTFLLVSSALIGLGYGACFSLVPIVISVVWGVDNFATNWGVVAVMPAPGAAFWSVVYSVGYANNVQHDDGDEDGDGQCHSSRCFMGWAWGCAASVALAALLWTFAWRIWRRRSGVLV